MAQDATKVGKKPLADGRGTPAALAQFAAELQREAESAWRFPGKLALVLFALPFVGAPVVAATWFYKRLFVFLTAEDRLLEWLQFFGYAGAAVLAGLVAWSLAKRGVPLRVTVPWALFALALVVIAGEEISWGQRVLGFETPERLEEANLQEEANIHNLGSIQTLNNITLLLVGLYGSLAPFLVRRIRSRRFLWLFVPPLFLTGAFFVLFAFKFGRFTVIPHYDAIVEFGEWPEFGLALALLVYAAVVLRRLTRSQTT